LAEVTKAHKTRESL